MSDYLISEFQLTYNETVKKQNGKINDLKTVGEKKVVVSNSHFLSSRSWIGGEELIMLVFKFTNISLVNFLVRLLKVGRGEAR